MGDADADSMETLTAATQRLQAAGYTANWFATDDHRLRCDHVAGGDPVEIDPADVVIDEIVRFEGASDPGDESILYALSGDGVPKGLFGSVYGPDMPTAEMEVIARMEHRVRGGRLGGANKDRS